MLSIAGTTGAMEGKWHAGAHCDSPFARMDAPATADVHIAPAGGREGGIESDDSLMGGNTIRSASAATNFRMAAEGARAFESGAARSPDTRGTACPCDFARDEAGRVSEGSTESAAVQTREKRNKVHLCEAEASESTRACACLDDEEQLPQFHLRISDGKYIQSIFRVPSLREKPGIGRSRHNAICLLADDQVSRFHAYLELTPEGSVVLKDGNKDSGLASSNGTFVNSNCTRISPLGYALHLGDVIGVGATEMVVEPGHVPHTVCTSPPLHVPPSGIWLRPDNENPWKKQMEKGVSSSAVSAHISRAKQLAFLMGTHPRLGHASPASVVPDAALMELILSNCSYTIHRAPPPALPARDKQGHQELQIDRGARCFPGERTAEEFLNDSSEPFPGRCGGIGDRPCVGFKVSKVVRVLNSSLWRPYHWRKQCIAESLPEMRELDSSKHLRAHPMGTGPPLDPAANEVLAFHGQSSLAIYSMKDAGICQEISDPASMFGGGVYLSCSAFRANMSVPCSSCGGGCLGSRADCTCQFDAGSEHVMLVARVTLGDAHVCTEYDADAYRGPPGRPRRRPPVSTATGFVHNSIVCERIADGGSHLRFRELVVYDRFQCYPEYIIHYKRVPGTPLSASMGAHRARRGAQCHYPL